MNQPGHIVSRRFSGNVVRIDKLETEIPAVLSLGYDKYDPSEIRCELVPAPDLDSPIHRQLRQFISHMPREIEFLTETSRKTRLRLFAFSSVNSSSSHIKLRANGYEIGLGDVSVSDLKFASATVLLTNAKCLSKWGTRTLHFDGNIKLKPGYAGEIEWNTPCGKFEARARHEYEETNVSGNRATLQIQVPSVSVQLDVTKSQSVSEAVKNVQQELRDVCLLLALCSRQMVDWFDLQIPLRLRDPSLIAGEQLCVRQSANRIDYSDSPEELINHRDLINGGFGSLLTNLRESPHADVLRRVIPFLVASHAPGFTETRFFLCYSALNALCVSIQDRTPIASTNQWEKIEAALKATLEKVLTEECLVSELDSLSRKLPTLRNISESELVLRAIGRLEVQVNDLWKEQSFEKGFTESRQMRNRLFHGASRSDIHGMHDNLIRLRILTERIVLKLLNWPLDKAWEHYDQELNWVN